jgi:hypothetical protein
VTLSRAAETRFKGVPLALQMAFPPPREWFKSGDSRDDEVRLIDSWAPDLDVIGHIVAEPCARDCQVDWAGPAAVPKRGE